MARFDKSSAKGTRPDAALTQPRSRSRASTAPSIEDTMFFPRLRRHAKWMFVFLALVFGLGFVVFGVGAGGVGVGDVFRSSGGAEAQSVSDAREATEERPKDPSAWRDLSTALQTEGDTAGALVALQTAVGLSPSDPDVYRELAALHLVRAGEEQQQAAAAQVDAAFLGASAYVPSLTTANGQDALENPIGRAVNALASHRATLAYQAAGAEAGAAVDAYEKLVDLQPDDPNVRIELAQAAQQAGDTSTAISAYEAFLRLAPDDPSASVVREQVKQLRQGAAG